MGGGGGGAAPPGGGGGAAAPAANPDGACMACGRAGCIMPCPGCCLGAVANSVLGLLCDDSMAFLRSASWRSAGVPCLSPLLSFL